MSLGGKFETWQAKEASARHAREAAAMRLAASVGKSKDWRCRIGRHDWREVEMPDRDKCAECARCGKRDWRRVMRHVSGGWRGHGDLPPGA